MNLTKILDNALKEFGEKNFIFEKKNGVYEGMTYKTFINTERIFSEYLIRKGFYNKNILLIGKNCIPLAIADTAIVENVGICVNVNQLTPEEEIKRIIDFYDIELILYTSEQEDKLKDIKAPMLNIIDIMPDFINNSKHSVFHPQGKDETACSKIVFSSGTTSNPKGVMLSQKNIFAGWEPLQLRTPFTNEVVYLFLPFNHTYANIYNFYYSFLSGLSLFFSSGTQNIISELQEVRPTIFCGVPLIFEKFAQYDVNLKKLLGGNIKYVFTGGAKLDKKIRDAYKKYGVELLDAYALTETASSFSIQYPGQSDDDSVGTVFENMDVKIINKDEHGIGQIVAKGDCIFLGYYGNKQATDSVFTEDGYFITGDLGYIKDNKLFLTGRDKKVLVSSNGENIYPDEIKIKIKNIDSRIDDVSLYLDNNNLCAKIFSDKINKDELKPIIEKYNSSSAKFNKIVNYDLFDHKTEKLMN